MDSYYAWTDGRRSGKKVGFITGLGVGLIIAYLIYSYAPWIF